MAQVVAALLEERRALVVRHVGGCHCGAVRFEVEAPEELEAYECNCSICGKVAFLHLIVPKSRFSLIQGEGAIVTYTFNTGVAKHLFCRTCGVKSFYIPRSNPDGYSVNVRCLNPDTIRSLKIMPFDGRNWEEAASQLRGLSRETRAADEGSS